MKYTSAVERTLASFNKMAGGLGSISVGKTGIGSMAGGSSLNVGKTGVGSLVPKPVVKPIATQLTPQFNKAFPKPTATSTNAVPAKVGSAVPAPAPVAKTQLAGTSFGGKKQLPGTPFGVRGMPHIGAGENQNIKIAQVIGALAVKG